MNIYESIGKRTGGDIYLGVVGPVRAGKSTFIKRFMDLLVLPNVKDTYERQRVLDEMPQSGSGRTITTTEPKFIPAEAVELKMEEMSISIRLVDCVGYMVPGALGDTEDSEPRMVATPWSEEKLPFAQAAETGTEKVVREHSTIAAVITTDGSIGTLEAEAYLEAEERVIRQLLELNKPFAVIMNSTNPEGITARKAAEMLEEKYAVPVTIMDCARATEEDINGFMADILGRFPVKEVAFEVPGYMDGLEPGHWLKKELIESIKEWTHAFDTIDDIKDAAAKLADGEMIKSAEIKSVDMSTGEVMVCIDMGRELYYRIISEFMGEAITDDHKFFTLLREFAEDRKAYGKLKEAMAQVENGGYGIVKPDLDSMSLEEPEVFRQGSKYGVKIRAKAPTLHIIETGISTEVSPVVGSQKQSEDLAASLKEDMKNSPNGIWDTNIFGKSLYEMVAEQMENKITAVPENIREKMQKSLQKISDEGKEYFICIVI